MSYYFEDDEVERLLDHIVKKICIYENKDISETIALYEKINVIFGIRSQKSTVKIDEAILDVVTRQYSKFFFPELMHQGRAEYMDSSEKFYKMLVENIVKEDMLICEIGSGLGKNAYFFSHYCNNVRKYYAIEKNELIVELNKAFLGGSNIEYILGDVFFDGYVENCDLYFAFNFFKYYKLDIIMKLLENLYNEHREIWIYDLSRLIDNIENQLDSFVPKLRVNDFFIIIGRSGIQEN